MGNYFSRQNEDVLDLKIKEALEKHQNWEKRYQNLLLDYQILESQVKARSVSNSVTKDSSISIPNLEKYIQEQILATDANSHYIPDPIERRVYLTIYKTVLETILQMSNTTSVNMFGHKITFQIEPEE